MLLWIFFEEINHAGDGGLYAEMIRNRCFEDADNPASWLLRQTGGAQGRMSIDTVLPLNKVRPKSLRIDVSQTGLGGSGRVGAANEGYWGMALRKGAAYHLSFFARCSGGFHGKLEASLQSSRGEVYASGSIQGLTPEWKRFGCDLESRGNRFVRQPGSYCGLHGKRMAQCGVAVSEGDMEEPDERAAARLWQQLLRTMPPRFRALSGGMLRRRGRLCAQRVSLEGHDRGHRLNGPATWNAMWGEPFHGWAWLPRVPADVRGSWRRAAVRRQLRHGAQGKNRPNGASLGRMGAGKALDAIEYANGPKEAAGGAPNGRRMAIPGPLA